MPSQQPPFQNASREPCTCGGAQEPCTCGGAQEPCTCGGAQEPCTCGGAQEPCWFVRDPAGTDGWEHGLPPAITPAQWPRHRTSGLPLVHGFTIVVQGQSCPGLSYFHPGDSESFPPDEEHATRVQVVFDGGALRGEDVGHPFWEALLAHAAIAHGRGSHPSTCIYTDILDHQHAVVWHTLEQLRSPRCERPPLSADIDGAAMRLDEPVAAELHLRLVKQEPQVRLIQVGWPLHPVQTTVAELRDRGFGPRVLEIEADVGGANYGDGNCQIDLERDLLDWACR